MCDVTRRSFLTGGAGLLGAMSAGEFGRASAFAVGKVDKVSEDVYFHEDDGGCNTGWVVFEDYVLVIDANFPSGAKQIVPKIRALTDRPIRFAFDTHHHGDHLYGNQVLMDSGAVPVAHTGVIDELKRYETGYYGGRPGRWEDTAKQRADVRDSRLKPPSVLFPKQLIFDDGKRRVELVHFGVAHTHGDAFAWLPNERILFSGDACVNGPYNYVADGSVEQWVKTLDSVRGLGARIVCPGHGSRGTDSIVGDQQAYFRGLWDRVGRLVKSRKSAAEIQGAVEGIRAELAADRRIARYVPAQGLAGQVEKVLNEMTGEKFPAAQKPGDEARLWHARQHGLAFQHA